MGKYDFKRSPDDVEDKVDKAISTLDRVRRLDEDNPLERAMKYDIVKKHPPKPGYMGVKLYTMMRKGLPVLYSLDTNEKIIEHDPMFSVDLTTAIQANIAACPSNVVPYLIDQAQQLVANEKKEYKPEKRKMDFNWWWILFIFLLIMPLIPLILLLI